MKNKLTSTSYLAAFLAIFYCVPVLSMQPASAEIVVEEAKKAYQKIITLDAATPETIEKLLSQPLTGLHLKIFQYLPTDKTITDSVYDLFLNAPDNHSFSKEKACDVNAHLKILVTEKLLDFLIKKLDENLIFRENESVRKLKKTHLKTLRYMFTSGNLSILCDLYVKQTKANLQRISSPSTDQVLDENLIEEAEFLYKLHLKAFLSPEMVKFCKKQLKTLKNTQIKNTEENFKSIFRLSRLNIEPKK